VIEETKSSGVRERTVAWQLDLRGNNGNARRSLAFGQVFARRLIPLNHALWQNISELTRTLLRVDKLGVTGSSPVPPIEKTTHPVLPSPHPRQ
jgi:hypothetical protein